MLFSSCSTFDALDSDFYFSDIDISVLSDLDPLKDLDMALTKDSMSSYGYEMEGNDLDGC
jgi:hypothetical protein